MYQCGALEEERLYGFKIHTTSMQTFFLDALNLDLASQKPQIGPKWLTFLPRWATAT